MKQENSEKFFANRDCKYYPCHEMEGDLNCLFCYCPLYHIKDCPGQPYYKEKGERQIKVCRNCTFPHRPENYEAVINCIMKSTLV